MSKSAFDSGNMENLKEPIEFPAIVGGKKITATIIAIGDNGSDIIYEIGFSDGYTDFFHMNDDWFRGEGPDARRYSEAIEQDMSIMAFYQPGKLLQNFRHIVRKEVNVWVQESNDENEPPTFAVHYFGRCQFWLSKLDDKWELILPAVNENGKDDAELVKRIGYLLDTLL